MNVEVSVQDQATGKIGEIVAACGDEGRRHLHSIAAYAVASRIQRHIHGYSRQKHLTASRLGAQPTGHYEKGAAAITSHADAKAGTVVIPIPGIVRAWKDLVVTPQRANALTLPMSAVAYGHRVRELEARGWTVFRPKGKNVLMGEQNGKSALLYALVREVRQPRDPSLLPTDEEIGKTAAESVSNEIFRIIRKARAAS